MLPLVTGGQDPVHDPQECFPHALIEAGIHSRRIWYDIRGFQSKTPTQGMRDHEDELVRLASDLLDWDTQAFGQLSTLWERNQLRARRRQASVASAVAAVLILLASLAIWLAFRARGEAQQARVASLVSVADSQRDPTTSALILREVAAIAGSPAPYGATNLAVRLATSARPIAVLRGHQGAVVTVTFNRRGDKLLSASQDGTARIWLANLKGSPIVLTGTGASLVDARFSHDGRRVVTASADGTARVWNSDGTGPPVVLQGHERALRMAKFSPDDSRVVTASDDGSARVWSVEGQSLTILRGHAAAVRSVEFDGTGDHVVTASDDGTSRLWSTDERSQPVTFSVAAGLTKFSSALFSPDERNIIVASDEGTGWIWSPTKEFPFITLIGGSSPNNSAEFSPDGRWAATASESGEVRIWNVKTLRPLVTTNLSGLTLDAHSPVRKTTFDPESARVAGITQNGLTWVWTVDGGREPLLLSSHDAPVLDVAFSPDGNRLATASTDATIRIWDTDGTAEPVVADVHRGPVADVPRCRRTVRCVC